MKILVFSDSHSRSNKISQALEMHKGVCDAVIFCGDGIRDLDYIKSKYPDIAFFAVKGNCDYFCQDINEEIIVNFDGIKIMITHGHKYGVKSTFTNVLINAKAKGADAVFFGHTHIPYDNIHDIDDTRIHLFNPGSIATSSTYGVVNTSGKVLVTNIAKI